MKTASILKLVMALTIAAAMGCASKNKTADASGEAPKAPDTNLTAQNVYDAGTFSEKEDISDLRIRGGRLFDTVPTEKFYSIDREKVAFGPCRKRKKNIFKPER